MQHLVGQVITSTLGVLGIRAAAIASSSDVGHDGGQRADISTQTRAPAGEIEAYVGVMGEHGVIQGQKVELLPPPDHDDNVVSSQPSASIEPCSPTTPSHVGIPQSVAAAKGMPLQPAMKAGGDGSGGVLGMHRASVRFRVGGMTCGACVAALEGALKR